MEPKKEPDWLEFERFVGRVECLLAPLGAQIALSSWIPDVYSGQKRQVDATIRYMIGTVPVLITIECRKSEDKEDQTWIEQLSTKRESLGAAKTIAVSSYGLTGPAVDLARRKNIEVRTMIEMSDDAIREWITSAKIIVHRREWKIRSFRVFCYDEGKSIEQLEQARASLFSSPGDDENGTAMPPIGQEHLVELARMLDTARNIVVDLNIPSDGQVHQKCLEINCPPGVVTLRDAKGSLSVRKVLYVLDITDAPVDAVRGSIHGEYRDDSGPLYQAAEYWISSNGTRVTVSFCREVLSGKMSSAVSIMDENTGQFTSLADPVIVKPQMHPEDAPSCEGDERIN